MNTLAHPAVSHHERRRLQVPLRPVRTLVVDDSDTVRALLDTELNRDPGIRVVGTAPHPDVAREMIEELSPDVVTLDLAMPDMNGLQFLREIMQRCPLPVVVVSSYTPTGGAMAMLALEAGAVDVLCKPGPGYSPSEMLHDLRGCIHAAATARPLYQTLSTPHVDGPAQPGPLTRNLVAVGASTGGTRVVQSLLSGLSSDGPAMVIALHMPAQFTSHLAERLNTLSAMHVKEAQDGDPVERGTALIAPGGRHLIVTGRPGEYVARVCTGARVSGHCPSVDVLFNSVADCAGRDAVGLIMTGMGHDGAHGLLAMRQAGARTLAQDEESCVVFGMPREAIALGAVDSTVTLRHLARDLMRAAR